MKLNEALERVEYMIRSSCPEAGGSNIGDCNKCLRTPCDDMKALLTITNAVSADRPHGEWKVIHNALGETKCQCNQCQHYVNSGDDKNFCPNCGADMRKEGERNE